MSAERNRDREAFVAFVLGILAAGDRFRAHLDATLAADAVPARPLEPVDLAVLGLLGFHARVETLAGAMTSDAREAAARPATGRDPALRELLR